MATANTQMNSGCMAKDSYNSATSKTRLRHTTTNCSPRLANPKHRLVHRHWAVSKSRRPQASLFILTQTNQDRFLSPIPKIHTRTAHIRTVPQSRESHQDMTIIHEQDPSLQACFPQQRAPKTSWIGGVQNRSVTPHLHSTLTSISPIHSDSRLRVTFCGSRSLGGLPVALCSQVMMKNSRGVL